MRRFDLRRPAAVDKYGVRVRVLRRQADGSWLRIIDRPEAPAAGSPGE